MDLTPQELTAAENALFDALEHLPGDRTFFGRLYRDGVPTPAAYLAQRARVLFVFREPNLRGVPRAVDMRDEVRDRQFRPLRDGERAESSVRGWWNRKAGMFAHAVAAALAEKPCRHSFREFTTIIKQREWNHEVVNRFAYIQIKKLGGRGSSNDQEICAHAKKYGHFLKHQIELYRPHMIVGCGIGRASPARLIRPLLGEGREETTSASRATWWRFSIGARPMVMLQLYHPSNRGRASELYHDVWSSVGEVARALTNGCGSG